MQLPYILTTKTNSHYFVPGNIHVPLFPPTVVCKVLAQDGTGAPWKGLDVSEQFGVSGVQLV